METLYLSDSYLKEFDSIVTQADGLFIILEESAFYPNSGGQPFDTGILKKGKEEFRVLACQKMSGMINHQIDKPGLKVGDRVHGILDWPRRYLHMRMHTAAHILSEVTHKDTGALITGNQLGVDQSRIDFSLDNYSSDIAQRFISKANEIVSRNLLVSSEYISRDAAMRLPSVTKLAIGLPDLKEFRIVSIGDFDMQADAGTHVRETKEIGRIEFVKAENKGKNNRRLYFKLA